MDQVTIESCHSRWFFDVEQRRFRRALKGLGTGPGMTMTQWRPYSELVVDPGSDSFVVVLNEAGTRVLRSWRHTGAACPRCGEAGTQELSIEDIARAR